MVATYKRPGVYLEESLLVNPSDVSGSVTVAAFVGVAEKGVINEPILVESWSDYVTLFGGFNPIIPPTADPIKTPVKSYLPYAVYSYFQNGGRYAYIVRSTATTEDAKGVAASVIVAGKDTGETAALNSFSVNARSVGTWGNSLQYNLITQSTIDMAPVGAVNDEDIFALQVLLRNSDGKYEVVETFSGLSVTGTPPGSRRIDAAVNDPYAGSKYVLVTGVTITQPQPVDTHLGAVSLAGGIDPKIPDGAALTASASVLGKTEGPINVNIVGYAVDASKAEAAPSGNYIGATFSPTSAFPGREDIVNINDSAAPRIPGQSSTDYIGAVSAALKVNPGDSYTASYFPWIIIPDPQRVGSTVSIPPGGAVAGMMSRIDATVGVFRAPAGVIASLSNALGVQVKFTDTELGDLNYQNINVIRPVVGAGICVMGGRTRKQFGADRYLSARRTLIAVKESLRRSTQWAVFENNDQRLWSGLRMTAERILRPLWEAGGLSGASSNEAYYVRCDAQLNTPNVIQSGEVRMEVGVALEYPAEFVVIKITQFDRGTFATETNA